MMKKSMMRAAIEDLLPMNAVLKERNTIAGETLNLRISGIVIL